MVAVPFKVRLSPKCRASVGRSIVALKVGALKASTLMMWYIFCPFPVSVACSLNRPGVAPSGMVKVPLRHPHSSVVPCSEACSLSRVSVSDTLTGRWGLM